MSVSLIIERESLQPNAREVSGADIFRWLTAMAEIAPLLGEREKQYLKFCSHAAAERRYFKRYDAGGTVHPGILAVTLGGCNGWQNIIILLLKTSNRH